jgi:hypothetical protein
MAINEFINPRCVQNCYQSCLANFSPRVVASYADSHMDTVPKFLQHVLVLMLLCNFFLVLCAWSISFLCFFLSFLLNTQNVIVLLVLFHGKMSFSPRFLNPTEFMVGVSLGISIGATILAFFLSVIFGKFNHACSHVEASGNPCEEVRSAIAAVWWWSSLVFWLNLLCCILLAAGRRDISNLAQYQYESIGVDDVRDIYQDHSQRLKSHQQQEQGGFVGDYASVPEVKPSIP